MIDSTKAKADAEEGLRIAEKATEGPWLNGSHVDEPRALCAAARPDESLLMLDSDGMAIFENVFDCAFTVDSRTRAPEAYRNVIEMAGVIDRLIAERNDLESRFAEVSADYREEHKRLVAMGVECDDLRAEVARLGAPGATMDGAPR